MEKAYIDYVHNKKMGKHGKFFGSSTSGQECSRSEVHIFGPACVCVCVQQVGAVCQSLIMCDIMGR